MANEWSAPDPDGWDDLASRWRTAFDAAWRSFGEGNFGIGAVLTDPACDDEVVAVGRNMAMSPRPADQPLAGNYLAHAEMNAYASLDRFVADGLRLTTTLQPCLMCAATSIFMQVADVEYAASDEYFAFLDQVWAAHPYTAERVPPSRLGLAGSWSSFARILPITHMIDVHTTSRAIPAARMQHPTLTGLIEGGLGAVLRRLAADGASVADGHARLVAALGEVT